MKTRFCRILAVLIICSLLLGGCGVSVPEGFNEEEMTAVATQVVELLNNDDYQAVCDMFREDLSPTANELSVALQPLYEGLGAFDKIDAYAAAGTEDESTGEDYGVIAVVCQYEEGTLQYTMTMNSDLQLVGLWAK